MELKEILEKIALPARSNKHGFYETEKLEAIKALLEQEGSPYHLIMQNEHSWIFGKGEPEKDKFSILISSHADIVNGITKPYSEYNEETKYFKGTYDNLGTNGACVALMLNEDLPDNVYFAFNDEEETGRCLGAAEALKYMTQVSYRQPFVIALDVTDEGYDNDRLFTLEGMNSHSAAIRERTLQVMLSGDGEEQSFEVVRMRNGDNCSMLPESYVSDNLTVFDESVYYAKQNCNSFSFDLPTEGSMHSDSGLYVKEPVFKGYVKSLLQTIYILDAVYPDKVEDIKKEKDEFVKQAKEVPFRKQTYHSYSSYSSPSSIYSGMGYSDYGNYTGYSSKWSYLHDYDDEDYDDFDDQEESVESHVIKNYLVNEAAKYGSDEYETFAENAKENFLEYYDDEEAEKLLKYAFEYVHEGVFDYEYYDPENDEESAELYDEAYSILNAFAESYPNDFQQYYADVWEVYGNSLFYELETTIGTDLMEELIQQAYEDANYGIEEEEKSSHKKEKKSKKEKYKQKDKSKRGKSLAETQKELEEDDTSYYSGSYKYSDDIYERGYYESEEEKDPDDYEDHGL